MKRGSNRGKIGRLHEIELRKHRMKVEDQRRKLEEQRRENRALYQTVENLGAAHTAIMAAAAETYGVPAEGGGKELVIPPVDIQRLAGEYDIKALRREDRSMVIQMKKQQEKA